MDRKCANFTCTRSATMVLANNSHEWAFCTQHGQRALRTDKPVGDPTRMQWCSYFYGWATQRGHASTAVRETLSRFDRVFQ